MQFISVIKAEFSASLLQSSVSHDSPEIILICWFAAQEKNCITVFTVTFDQHNASLSDYKY